MTPTDKDYDINLNICYKNPKTAQLLIKNNPAPPQGILKKSNVVYLFQCPEVGCSHNYVGMTTTKLSKRISCHLQEENVLKHFQNCHKYHPTRETILPAFSVIDSAPDPRRLRYLEALHILEKRSTLNVTQETLLLPLAKPRRN